MDKELNELIDRYVKGQLTVEERQQLEARVKQSETFRQIVEDHVELVDAMVEYGRHLELKQKLETAHEEMTGKVKSIEKKKSSWEYWPHVAIAASVALVS